MTVQPPKPDSEPGSEQADHRFENLPETLPDEAKSLYFNAYHQYVDKHGNNPELAHQIGMAAVMEHYRQNETTGEWSRKP